MTHVKFSLSDGELVFRAYGHAGDVSLKKRGDGDKNSVGINPDIVCAAVSILCYTLAQTVKYLESEGGTEKPPTVCLTPGDCRVSVIPKPEYFAYALHSFFTVETGFSLLARSFGENVEIIGE